MTRGPVLLIHRIPATFAESSGLVDVVRVKFNICGILSLDEVVLRFSQTSSFIAPTSLDGSLTQARRDPSTLSKVVYPAPDTTLLFSGRKKPIVIVAQHL